MFDRVLNTSLNILQVIRKTVRFTKQENSFLQSKKYLGTFTDRQTNTFRRTFFDTNFNSGLRA